MEDFWRCERRREETRGLAGVGRAMGPSGWAFGVSGCVGYVVFRGLGEGRGEGLDRGRGEGVAGMGLRRVGS